MALAKHHRGRLYWLAPCGKPACPPAPAGAAGIGAGGAGAGPGLGGAEVAAGKEAAAAGASLETALEVAGAPDAAGAADSSLPLLHAARTIAASRDAMRRDFFTIASFYG